METKDLLKKVRKIEIKTRRLSDHIFSGEYHTSFKGRGMTFSEVRPYQYGDDIRAIDWNVTARYNEAHVKVFEEERELTMVLMVDISGSESFGSKNQFKKDIVTEIAATMAFSATQNNDKIGLILFSDQIELYIPPKFFTLGKTTFDKVSTLVFSVSLNSAPILCLVVSILVCTCFCWAKTVAENRKYNINFFILYFRKLLIFD